MIAINVTNADWAAVLPITIVAVAALIVLLADLLAARFVHRMVAIGISLVGLVAAGATLWTQWASHATTAAFGGAFMLGGFSIVFQEIIIIASIIIITTSTRSVRRMR